MKRLFTLLFFVAIGSALFGQKCKFDIEEEDPFTGKMTLGNTSPLVPASPMSYEFWYLGLNKVGDDFHVGMLVQLNGELNTTLSRGDSIMFKLENDQIITCYAQENYSPTSDAAMVGNQPVITTQYRANYSIMPSELEAFKANPLTDVRMNISDKVYQQEIQSKHAKKLMKNATCILK